MGAGSVHGHDRLGAFVAKRWIIEGHSLRSINDSQVLRVGTRFLIDYLLSSTPKPAYPKTPLLQALWSYPKQEEVSCETLPHARSVSGQCYAATVHEPHRTSPSPLHTTPLPSQ